MKKDKEVFANTIVGRVKLAILIFVISYGYVAIRIYGLKITADMSILEIIIVLAVSVVLSNRILNLENKKHK